MRLQLVDPVREIALSAEDAPGKGRGVVFGQAGQRTPEPGGMFGPLRRRHEFALAAVEAIIPVAWGDVHVIVPDILVTAGLIVLADRDAIACVCSLHGQCDAPL